jgi:chorismate synthase
MNTFGRIFRITIFGESHGPEIGVIIDGCPPGIAVSEKEFLPDLNRRRVAKKTGTTTRKEDDLPEFRSGVYKGKTTGAPLAVVTKNRNAISSDYDQLIDIPRPGHSDMPARIKYLGNNDPRGGGHFSGRLTWGLVVAGTIAKKILSPVVVKAEVIEAGGSSDIQAAVEKATAENDSIGGIVQCRINDLPAGIGEPFFLSVESAISQIVFSVPAIKGIEFGSGFKAATMYGSEHNDPIIDSKGSTRSNHAGGINGGISNGNEIYFNVAVKPTSSIAKKQETIDLKKNKITELNIGGRHDTCIALRVPVVIESVAAIAIADLMMIDRAIYVERKQEND